MVLSGLIISSCLVAFALLWIFAARLPVQSPLRRTVQALTALPVHLWLLLGVAAFALPVLEYWLSARSHGNAVAGFLPWADAIEYFHCSEIFLQGMPSVDHCGKRPFYIAFFTNLLWLTGNRLQPALLLQALIVGAGAVFFTREVTRNYTGPAALSTYAVLYIFASVLCASLVMTENIGFFLGLLGMALLWRAAVSHSATAFVFGIAIMAAGLSARPGPMFVLPALLFWVLLHGEGPLRKRAVLAAFGCGAAFAAMGLTATPILIAGGTLGSTHSNFSYSLYGLAAGGKGWLQVMIDHPEFFTQGGAGRAVTDRVYGAAIEIILNKPHLFVLGYIKGIANYLDDLFRYATGFKPLRLAGLLLPWLIGVWSALKQWRQPQFALLLAMQGGILISSPFIAIDGQNRVFAATVAVDALFVALGIVWISKLIASKANPGTATPDFQGPGAGILAGAGATALMLPIVMLAAIRANASFTGYTPPSCEAGLEAVIVRPGQSTLVLPLVKAGEETFYPLRARADYIAARFHKNAPENHQLTFPPGTTLYWGTRLEEGSIGQLIYFSWAGEQPPAGRPVGFCVKRPSGTGKKIGTAVAIDTVVSPP